MNIEDIKTYIECPMMYGLNNECKIPKQTYATINQKYIIEMRKMVYFFFNMIQDNNPTSLYHLKKEWGKLWIKSRQKKELLLPTSNPIVGWNRKKEQDGMDAIIRLFNYFEKMEFDIVGTNMKYVLSCNRGDSINGVWPLIIVQKEMTKIIDFRLSTEDFSVKNDIILTAMSAAYRKYFNDIESSVGIYLLDKGKIIESTRCMDDYRLLYENYNYMKKNIKQKMYMRNLGKKCESCQFDILCKGGL